VREQPLVGGRGVLGLEVDLGAVAARAATLRGLAVRHMNTRQAMPGRGRPGDRLRRVPGRPRDDAALPLGAV
jgi:hypothetical protein